MHYLLEIIDNLENSSVKINELDVYCQLRSLDIAAFPDGEVTLFKYELMAFSFQEKYCWTRHGDDAWGTYLGPLYVGTNKKDGSTLMHPDINEVSSDVISYWCDRFHKTPSPILRIRYGILLWDFFKKINNATCPIEIIHKLIDSIIEVINKRSYPNEIDEVQKLKLALSISLAINDQERISAVKTKILDYDSIIAETSGVPAVWIFACELLLDSKKKIQLSTDEEIGLISRLKKRLDILCEQAARPGALSLAKKIAMYLAKYYRSKDNKHSEIFSIIEKYLNVLYSTASQRQSLHNQFLLQAAFELANTYGLKHEVEKITLKLQEESSKAQKDMREISAVIPVDNEKLIDYITKMTEGDLFQCLKRCAISCIFSKSSIEEELKNLAKSSPITYSSQISIKDPMGRPVITLGSLHDDFNGHIYYHAGKKIMFQVGVGALREAINVIFEKHEVNAEILLSYLYASPLFTADKKEILRLGLLAYIEKRPIEAIHILAPQIEDALRKILTLHGQPVYKSNRNGGYNLRLLDDVLRDRVVENILGNDIVFYFKVLLTEQRGLNLRNDICHGLSLNGTFTMEVADLLFGILIILSEVRAPKNSHR